MLEKIVFGYDSEKPETFWAQKKGENNYILDNIPIFTDGISYMDCFSAELIKEDGRLGFSKILNRGGHTTVRIIFLKDISEEERKKIIDELFRFTGVSCESIKRIFGLDIPNKKDVKQIISILERLVDEQKLIFEISCDQTSL